MLPQENRLRAPQDFSQVYRRGMRRHSSHLTLRALRITTKAVNVEDLNPQPVPPSRIGISISLKVSKRSVVRNRIKRQIRAALRQMLPRLAPGWHLVVVVHHGALECNYAEFLRELEQLLVEAEVLDGNSRRCLL